jgi:hypothetical protein
VASQTGVLVQVVAKLMRHVVLEVLPWVMTMALSLPEKLFRFSALARNRAQTPHNYSGYETKERVGRERPGSLPVVFKRRNFRG